MDAPVPALFSLGGGELILIFAGMLTLGLGVVALVAVVYLGFRSSHRKDHRRAPPPAIPPPQA